LVYPGETDLHLPQPVNVILLSDLPHNEMMQDLGWYKNLTYTHNEIGLIDYLDQLIKKTPPISELYFNSIPADGAYQLPGTIKSREHIRWWVKGNGVQLGAISKDEELAIK